MNNTFTQRQRAFFLKLSLFSTAFFGLHFFLLHYWQEDTPFFYPLWMIYIFHFATVFLVYTIINFRTARGKKGVFFTFMTLTFLKMILAIVFLIPLFVSKMEEKQVDVFNFFIPYFLFLSIEVYSITKFLRKV